MNQYRKHFPFFETNPNYIYFDNSYTTLKPRTVIEALYDKLINLDLDNTYDLDKEQCRIKMAKLINAKTSKEIIFTSSTTLALNQVAYGLQHLIDQDDEILTTKVEHVANLLPWIKVSKEKKAKIIEISVDSNGLIDIEDLKSKINSKTKVLTFASMTNTLGGMNNIKAITQAARSIKKDIIIVIDAAQSIAHYKHDVQAEGADFLVNSMHKIYGPYHLGIIWGRYEMLEKLKPCLMGAYVNVGVTKDFDYSSSLELPYKLEPLPLKNSTIKAFNAALDFILDIKMETIENHNKELKKYALELIDKYNLKEKYDFYNLDTPSGILIFNHKQIKAEKLFEILKNKYQIIGRAGINFAYRLNEVINTNIWYRFTFGIYNTKEEIDKTMEILSIV
ncbi:MAG: aminotransferase class V-fold PLP-dependent enzyme [Mycoplasma sp.]|nr:aminotransferase class V-fold PLP-dependent enzyme [Mycoplasma sp.]